MFHSGLKFDWDLYIYNSAQQRLTVINRLIIDMKPNKNYFCYLDHVRWILFWRARYY